MPAPHRSHTPVPPPSSKPLCRARFYWQLLYWGEPSWAQHSMYWSHKEGDRRETTTSLSLHWPMLLGFHSSQLPPGPFCKAAFYPAYRSTIWLQRCFGRFWHLACRGFSFSMHEITYKSTKTTPLAIQFNFSWLCLTRKTSNQRTCQKMHLAPQSSAVILTRFNSCCLHNTKTRSLIAFYLQKPMDTFCFFLKRWLVFVDSI